LAGVRASPGGTDRVSTAASVLLEREQAMTDTATHEADARRDAPPLQMSAWHCDYSICTCTGSWDDCPHCGLSGSDAHHRGRCHARSRS
jgi:hypothetical protein